MATFIWPPTSIDTTGLATEATALVIAQNTSDTVDELQTLNAKVTVVDTGNVTVVSSALPTGAATAAKQDTGNASLASIDSKLTNPLPISAASLPLPTGAATEATLSTLNGKVTAVNTGAVVVVSSALPSGAATEATLSTLNGKVTAVNTGAVVVASSALPSGAATLAEQQTQTTSLSSIDSKLTSPLTVTGPLTDTQLRATPVPVSGTVTTTNTANGATGSAVPAQATQVAGSDGTNLRALKVSATGVLSVDGSAVTQPISAASLPLPSGAATEATLSTLNGKVTAVNTGAVVVASSALPSGAATDAVATANGVLVGAVNETAPGTDTASSGLNGRLQRIAQRLTSLIALLPTSLGQKTSANSLAVVFASDQSALSVTASATSGSISKVNTPVYSDYSSTPVTTSAYVQLVASTATQAQQIEIIDTSGQFLYLAFGAAASEVDQFIISPGGNGRFPLLVPASTRVSIKAIDASATAGAIAVNFYA